MPTTTVYRVESYSLEEGEWVTSRAKAIKLARTKYAAPTGHYGTVDAYELPFLVRRKIACLLLSGEGFADKITPIILPSQGVLDDESDPE